MRRRLLPLLLSLIAACANAAPAASGIQRTIVGRADVSTPGREAVVAHVELKAGASSGRHTHPGDEISYMTEGEALLLIDGEEPRTVKAGESFVVPAGKVHEARNVSGRPARLIAVYIVEKGKALAAPAN